MHAPLDENERHDLPAMAAARHRAHQVILVCTPNNPTGTSVTADELHEFASRSRARARGGGRGRRGLPTWTRTRPAASIFLRYRTRWLFTFSKVRAGRLRIGYAIPPDYISAALRAVAIPFGVTNLAQQAAGQPRRTVLEVEERIAPPREQRDHVHQRLTEQGWDVVQSQANFVLAAHG
ncbi:aminotransferase class I/II-fold pyridoxal phosphate-dependent enzyme [Kocuria rhizophila]|nr:aminotransferase class I/II-fold pyridoxal phosphate-dependent enzyme [Kocuria rhizophila]